MWKIKQKELIKFYLFDQHFFIILIDCKSSAWAGELDEEDQEEDNHVEEEEDLVVPDSSNKTNDRDHEEEDSTSSNAPNYGKTSHYARNFPWNMAQING